VNDLTQLIQLINTKEKFLIASHENPDQDAIGSTVSLGLGLERLNKKVFLYNESGVPESLRFMPGSNRIFNSISKIPDDIEIVFIVDCTDSLRVGRSFNKYYENLEDVITVTIDHHLTSKNNTDFCIVDHKASSTGYLIYKLLKNDLKVDMSLEIAKNIYASIVGDTGSFSYSNTDSDTLKVAGDLLDMGVDPYEIFRNMYESEPVEKLRLIGLVLNTLEIIKEGKVAIVQITKKMLTDTCTTKEHTEGIINYPRSIKGVQIAVLLREEEIEKGNSKWKISLRSKGLENVAVVAERFGGGGHKNAAGCAIEGNISEVKQSLISEIDKILK